jgi:hypothetical protein
MRGYPVTKSLSVLHLERVTGLEDLAEVSPDPMMVGMRRRWLNDWTCSLLRYRDMGSREFFRQ